MLIFEEVPNRDHSDSNVSKTDYEHVFSHSQRLDSPAMLLMNPILGKEKVSNGCVLDEMNTFDFYRLLGY